MKNILFINGSPRGNRGNSHFILEELRNWLGSETGMDESGVFDPILILPGKLVKEPEDILKRMDGADCWIIAFPLYIDALPGHLTWWLEQYRIFRKRKKGMNKITVYALANCGFPEAVQNREALEIMKLFCRKNGLEFRMGAGIGMGEAYKEMGSIPLKSRMKGEIVTVYREIKADLDDLKTHREFLFASVKFPRLLYRVMGDRGWKRQAVRNGIKAKDLYARPYAP